MRWSDRQAAMLAEMGLPLPPSRRVPVAAAPAAPLPIERELPAIAVGSADPVALADSPDIADQMPVMTVARLDWPALREAVAACVACALHAGRTQPVFGVGRQDAHWMIVGEAPGEQEDQRGEPFVGKSGQLLDNMLESIGLTRDKGDAASDPARHVYIANTIKCRPPGNRNPAPDELDRCEPFLIRQIELLRPKIILAMGRFAVQSLLRSDEPVGRLRGRLHRYQGVPLVVTYHPAYLLRNPIDKARAWDDLCLALEAYRSAGSVSAS